MGAPTDIWSTGPTGGVAATILAIGSAFLLIAWKALPLFREWAAAIREVRGIGQRAAGRLDDLIQDHIRLRADVARLLELATPPSHPDRDPTMSAPAPAPQEVKAVADEVKFQLRGMRQEAAEGGPPGEHRVGAIDLDQVLAALGTVDDVVAKLYPVLAPFLPPGIIPVANIIVRVIEALAHRGTTPP